MHLKQTSLSLIALLGLVFFGLQTSATAQSLTLRYQDDRKVGGRSFQDTWCILKRTPNVPANVGLVRVNYAAWTEQLDNYQNPAWGGTVSSLRYRIYEINGTAQLIESGYLPYSGSTSVRTSFDFRNTRGRIWWVEFHTTNPQLYNAQFSVYGWAFMSQFRVRW